MSNYFAPYAWEAVTQQKLNQFCDDDLLPTRARYKWVHIYQACKMLDMTPLEIYKEGKRDFLAVRTAAWHYLDVFHHVDGILHPDPIITYMGKAAFERFGNKVYRELHQSGLPTQMDLALFSLIFEDPEAMHRKVRKSLKDVKGRRRILDAVSLPKNAWNGRELREMGLWQDMDEVELEAMRDEGIKYKANEGKEKA